MPPIYYLNPPPNPFWQFVADLEDVNPVFAGRSRRAHRHNAQPTPPSHTEATPDAAEMSEKTRGKQPTVEDPPEVDPSTVKPEPKTIDQQKEEKDFPFRSRGRFAHALDADRNERRRGRFGHALDSDNNEDRRGRGERPCRRGRGRGGWNGPPPFLFGHPFFANSPWAQQGPQDRGHEHRGPPVPPSRRGPCAPGPDQQPSNPSHGSRPGFDLSQFLNKLGDRLGVDLSNAAEGLGLTAERSTAPRASQEINFEPRADIFENKTLYTVHLSLPGAKKSDIGVDYDGEHSLLRVTGVVHRPEADEQMLNELIVDGRKRETGVFEKAIRLGTKKDPANIDVASISAKMSDGILIVRIPKLEKLHQKREVPITTDALSEGQADYDDEYSERPALFDAEEQASVAGTEATVVPAKEPISLNDMNDGGMRYDEKERLPPIESSKLKSKDQPSKQENEQIASAREESLPAYTTEAEHEEDDWEKFSDASGEGEYIKINVD